MLTLRAGRAILCTSRSEVVSHDDLVIDDIAGFAKPCAQIEPARSVVPRLHAKDDTGALGHLRKRCNDAGESGQTASPALEGGIDHKTINPIVPVLGCVADRRTRNLVSG